MKPFYLTGKTRSPLLMAFFAILVSFSPETGTAQTCPAKSVIYLSQSPNTYYPGTSPSLSAGGKSITLGAAGSGSVAISAGDILLVMQMQGATINGTNNDAYGDAVAGGYGNGYISNNSLMAGNMEYVIATNSVPLTGGSLSIQTGLINNYQNLDFNNAVSGQYRYQVIRVPMYYTIQIWGGGIGLPKWNGTSGGVLILSASDSIVFNGNSIDGSGAGFRGGAGRSLTGGLGGSGTTYFSMSTSNYNGSKGEGIAGTPRYVNNLGALLDNGSTNEGYPGGSYARGAPGNAGGGGTDYDPSQNDQNSGGGGGGNGSIGGVGGNSWSTAESVGGNPGGSFLQASAKSMVMGGGGGAGTSNNATGVPGNGFASSGAEGGGIVILLARAIGGTGTINVNGGSGNATVQNDGSGGAGAGGSVMIYSINASPLSGITVTAMGGTGGSNSGNGADHGPGGGGGGGVIYSNATLNAASSAAGGAHGTTAGGVAYGSSNGSAGSITQNITQIQTPIFPSNCSILPLEFISVTANSNKGMVAVGWEVAREVDVEKYLVERSSDGSNFMTVGTVDFKPSAENEDNLYNFTDNAGSAAGNTLYYRIEGIDQSGQPIYSKIVAVSISANAFNQNLSVFPNPVVGSATISFTSANGGLVNLRLVDMSGRMVWQKSFNASAGTNTLALDNLSNYSNGIYTLQWSDGVKIQNAKVLVNH